MSLSSALNIAQSSLKATSRQTSIVSRNVSDGSNPDYSRRSAMLVYTDPGVSVVKIRREANDLLFRQNLSALSAWSGQGALAKGMDKLELQVNGVDNASSASTAIGNLQKALQLYATTPSNQNLGSSVVEAARQVVRSLNDGTKAIQDFRTQTDGEITTAVNDINDLLKQFEVANKAVVSGTRSGGDVSDALDNRDAILKKISEYVPISTYTRGDNDMVITTGDGTTLFETIPRSVTFTPSAGYAPGAVGGQIYIDNVPLKTTGVTDAPGKLAGMLQLRDNVTVTMQSQLDEIARGLVTAFSESATGQPTLAGLFTWSGGPAVPPAGTLVDGIAGTIKINPAVDPSAGGNPVLLRDGGINGAVYRTNPNAAGSGASYADRLIAYGEKLTQPMAFDPAAGITANSSLVSYAASSIGWFEGVRQQASTLADTKEALAQRTGEALSNATGVNVDTEMSLMLDLEHTYQASAKILTTVNQMLDTLLSAVR
ncbi:MULTISPECIES: flagellar hook-associated protein FlgK [Phyllobacteriaceae]|jgi:flagellar hook-associated protein 1|uniref:Flagellar hook-associated protein 1 n=3 Tax=Pseudomonadota TaxID=1224 RepID=A0A1C2EA68_9HYPH|nr:MULTISPECIES: flagellar hook-associated protein FlgK [Mesorhizobium]MBN9237154.1 flagellar hook-associated protein FlgK [Mesorhizobium sp.]MDQ0329358.1 flagellar hook-associated protein 1 FlgK [Mesorhizobium sp. YL-MeA3-2017]OCX23886.1 flagellar hook-associated protein FlgK [Mesorhizobium hungaricum]